MASGRNPPTAGGDDSKEQAAQWHVQWVDDVALFDRVLCRLALVVGADDGGRSASLDYGTRAGLLASFGGAAPRRQRALCVPRSWCGTDVIEQTTPFGEQVVGTWRVSELGR